MNYPMADMLSTEPVVHELGIDVGTDEVAELIAQLNDQNEVHFAYDGGVYREDSMYSQVHVTSLYWDEEELDDWLYDNCTVHYVGTFTRT